MTCKACKHEWTLLPAHVARTEEHGCQAQCPACGNLQEISRAELAECYD